jgi:hypothetical protein
MSQRTSKESSQEVGLSLNRQEQVYYSIAESAAMGVAVNGVLACRTCSGCGLRPSGGEFTGWKAAKVRAVGFAPVKFGVDVCTACGGEGVAR